MTFLYHDLNRTRTSTRPPPHAAPLLVPTIQTRKFCPPRNALHHPGALRDAQKLHPRLKQLQNPVDLFFCIVIMRRQAHEIRPQATNNLVRPEESEHLLRRPIGMSKRDNTGGFSNRPRPGRYDLQAALCKPRRKAFIQLQDSPLHSFRIQLLQKFDRGSESRHIQQRNPGFLEALPGWRKVKLVVEVVVPPAYRASSNEHRLQAFQ